MHGFPDCSIDNMKEIYVFILYQTVSEYILKLFKQKKPDKKAMKLLKPHSRILLGPMLGAKHVTKRLLLKKAAWPLISWKPLKMHELTKSIRWKLEIFVENVLVFAKTGLCILKAVKSVVAGKVGVDLQ